MADAKWPYAVTGTWPEATGSGLAVKLLDKTYTLGKDDALRSDGKGNYTFSPTVDLKPGTYDLNFSVKLEYCFMEFDKQKTLSKKAFFYLK